MSKIAKKLIVEFDLEEDEHCALCEEAARLSMPPEELVKRAVAAWLVEIGNDTTQ